MDNGKATIIASIIAAIATLAAAVIGLYGVTLQKENSALQVQNTESQSEIIELRDRISKSEETVSSLQETISQLRTTQGQSENENSVLQGQLSALQDENTRLTQELEVLQNSTLPDEDTSLQQQISALKEENSGLKREIETLRGGSPLPSGTSYDFLTVCPPYEASNFSTPDFVTIMGKKYSNGFTMTDYSHSAYAYFNLDAKYSRLTFDVGHVDGTDMASRTIKVFLDGELEQILEVTGDMLVTSFEIPVPGAMQLLLQMNDGSYAPEYGFINAKIFA